MAIIQGTFKPAAPAITTHITNQTTKPANTCIVQDCILKQSLSHATHLCTSHQFLLDSTPLGQSKLIVQLKVKWESDNQTFATITLPMESDLNVISQHISLLPNMNTFRWKILFNGLAILPEQYSAFTTRYFLPFIYLRRFNRDGTINTMRATADAPVILQQPKLIKNVPGVGSIPLIPTNANYFNQIQSDEGIPNNISSIVPVPQMPQPMALPQPIPYIIQEEKKNSALAPLTAKNMNLDLMNTAEGSSSTPSATPMTPQQMQSMLLMMQNMLNKQCQRPQS